MGMAAEVDFEAMAKEPAKKEVKTSTAEKKLAVMTGEMKDTKEEK